MSDAAMVQLLQASTEEAVCEILVKQARAWWPAARIRSVAIRSGEARLIVALAGDGEAPLPLAISRAALAAAGAGPVTELAAHIVVVDQWHSCFGPGHQGFGVPLVSDGELVGLVDVGQRDAIPELSPDFATMTSVAALRIRALRLSRNARSLRDYTTRLMDYSSALLVGLDRNWRITRVNRAVLDLIGQTEETLVGRDLRDIVPADRRPAVLSALAAAEAGEVASVRINIGAPQGSIRTAWTISRVAAESGLLEAFIAMGSEFSRIDALEQRIASAERLATTGRMAAGIVHELGSPLTSITVYADYLARALRDRGDADYTKAERIGMAAERILRFSKELVQYSRPVPSESARVDVPSVVADALALCEHLVKDGLELSADIAPVPKVLGVAGQIEQLIVNLVTNAVHAVSGQGRVRVRVAPADQWVAIAVADDGPGIAPADRERIFEPFYTTKTDGKGTGLGLAIVRSVVEQLGGRIEIGTSDLGGAEFRVLLPSIPASSPAQPVAAQ